VQARDATGPADTASPGGRGGSLSSPLLPADAGDSPFRRRGLAARLAPFTAIAVIAELSLAVPPRSGPFAAVVVSAAILLAVAAATQLPWGRLPRWSSVLIPIGYAGSVLALNIAGGPNSGVGLVLLIPLVWCVLYHRWGESVAVAVAVVAVEVITSVVQSAPTAVTARRAVLWALLSAVILVGAHRLRDQLSRSYGESMQLQEQLTVVGERDRIAATLQDQVVGKLFAAGISMQGAAALATSQAVRDRAERSIGELDEAIGLLRDAVFAVPPRPQGEIGLRQRVLELCRALPEPPAATFSGRVEDALTSAQQEQVLTLLREAMTLVATDGQVQAIALNASSPDMAMLTCSAELPPGPALELFALRESAARAGTGIEIVVDSGRVDITWQFRSGAIAEPVTPT
jgi:signal transduction histidine kinase